jgi:hypothetical protein
MTTNESRPAESHETAKASAADRTGTPVNSVVVCSCATRSASPPRGTITTEAVLADEAIPRLDHPEVATHAGVASLVALQHHGRVQGYAAARLAGAAQAY